MNSKKMWKFLSEKLDTCANERVKISQLFEALLNEKDDVNEETLTEKCHWWEFLSEEVADIPVEELKKKVRKINEQFETEIEREAKYCELLKTPSIKCSVLGPRLEKQLKDVPPIILTDAYTVRWVYTYQLQNESEMPKDRRVTLNTIRRRKKEGKINTEIIKLCKIACFIDRHIADGTPDKYSKKSLRVDLSKL